MQGESDPNSVLGGSDGKAGLQEGLGGELGQL